MEQNRFPEFTSCMTKGEYIKALVYLPIHMIALPLLLFRLMDMGYVDESLANFLIYVIGAAYMLLLLGRYLRRDFDPLADRPFYCVSQICGHYLAMLLMNTLVNGLVMMLIPEENPNNAAIMSMAGMDFGKVSAMAICLAPIVEEIVFRGAIFGLIRRKSRVLAYVISILGFSLYHVLGYALSDPVYFVYLIQYLPGSFLLCRCYEKTNSIWSPIFFHMLVNGMSMSVMEALL